MFVTLGDLRVVRPRSATCRPGLGGGRGKPLVQLTPISPRTREDTFWNKFIRKLMLMPRLGYSIMSPQIPDVFEPDVLHATVSRRRLLGVGGVLALGGLAGCLDRVASTVTNTGASPAAVFAGSGGRGGERGVGFGTYVPVEGTVTRLTPSLTGGSGVLSGEVELEGWVTSTAISAANYNNTRSNKAGISAPDTDDGDSDGDGIGDETSRGGANYNNTRSNRSGVRFTEIIGDDVDETDERFRTVEALDTELQQSVAAAVTAISKRSARTGRNPELEREISNALTDIEKVLAELRGVFERCSEESCATALEAVGEAEAQLSRIEEHVDKKEWEEGAEELTATDENPLFSQGAMNLVLNEYLGGDPVIAEQFAVSLPDAELPGGDRSIRDEVTPKRFIDYMTGRIDGEGRVYSWGDPDSDGDGFGDCDDSRDTVRPGAVCGTTPHFVAALSNPLSSPGELRAVHGTDRVTVVNTPPEAVDGDEPLLPWPGSNGSPDVTWAAVGEGARVPSGLSGWGPESGSSSETATAVCPVVVQPPECPVEFPALLYVKRCRNDEQLIYTGGWIIDDSALYEGATTVLTVAGSTQVVGVGVGDLDGDGWGDVVSRSSSSERAMRGARVDYGSVDSLMEGGIIEFEDGHDRIVRKKPGRTAGDDGEDGGVIVTHVALDAPVLHLVNAGDASTDVKFKAGAELSGQVN